jgi:hypothetical protein
MCTSFLARLSTTLFVLALVGGCATPQPIPFQLVDAAARPQHGTFYPDTQRIEAIIDGQLFSGFYIVASEVAYSQTFGGRRFFPRDTVTTVTSNSARAHLTAADGQRLNCEFLLEARRALGECRSPAGAVYQLIAGDR